MADHKSALKRARQNEKRRDRNQALRSKARTETKKAIQGILSAPSLEEGLKALRSGERALRKAASKGVLAKQRASRKVSRLAAALCKKFKAQSQTSASR
ncbi:MAG: 30S ribosomal protein S20 [Bdellovibrionota bacterium]